MAEKGKSRTINGVSAQAANKLARAAADEIAHMQREDRERFYDVAARLQDMIERAVAIDGERARASAERVAAATLHVIFGQIGDDEPGARLRLNANSPGAFRVHTHRRQAPSLRSIIKANKARTEAEKQQRQKQGIDEVTTEP